MRFNWIQPTAFHGKSLEQLQDERDVEELEELLDYLGEDLHQALIIKAMLKEVINNLKQTK